MAKDPDTYRRAVQQLARDKRRAGTCSQICECDSWSDGSAGDNSQEEFLLQKAAANTQPITFTKHLGRLELEKDGSNLGFLLTPGEKKRVHIAPVAKAHLPSTEPVTLESLMSPKTPVAHLSLSRRKRFEIAAAAAWATLLLYDTPWLTDTWDKAGLYFFLEKNTTNNIFAANPCISTEVNKATSTRRFQSKLIRNEAVFALGILLIELCLNRPFDELSKQGSTGTGSNSIMEDYEMPNILLDQVFLDAGDLYGDACRLCIRFEFPGRDVTKNFRHEKFRQDFYNEVVAPIQATFSAIPK
ncbi:hypothetical protein D6D28_07758 [Aureobasidium pullulans]|uniref:DUF7580 domain-containing protein n=1 Tax=Aureobasidium pullulans TaxID=5580 RepID=A0A4S8SA78_AURPU|nr:hypothetical protein D6D28_07758 [Aureobasidium pullulans]